MTLQRSGTHDASPFGLVGSGWLALLFLALASNACAPEAGRAGPASVVANSPVATAPEKSACQSDAARLGSAALAQGRLLRARHYLREASADCPEEVAEDIKRLAEQIPRPGSPKQQLEQAAAARAANDLSRARAYEAAAVLELERQSGEALRLAPHVIFDAHQWSREGRYLLLTGREQLHVIDSQSGDLVARVPRLDRPGERAQYHHQANRLVQIALGKMPCILEVVVFDTIAGAEVKRLCGSDFAFSADGSRLAVSEIHGMADGAIMSLAVLDLRSLEVVHRIERPGDGQGNISKLTPSSDGTKVAVQWATGMSVVHLDTGQTWQVEAEPFGGPRSATFHTRLAWTEEAQVFVWEPYAKQDGSGELASWSPPDCSDPTIAISPTEDRIAIGCGKVVWFWQVGSPPATAKSVKLAHPLFNLRWFGHGGALLVKLAHGGPLEFLVIDPKRRRTLFTTERESIKRVALATGLLRLQTGRFGEGGTRVVRLEPDASFDKLNLQQCRMWDEGINNLEGTAVVTCGHASTWLFRADATEPRHLPVQVAGRLAGRALVQMDLGELELRSAEDGALLPGSPHGWLSPLGAGYWDVRDKEFVIGMADRKDPAIVSVEPKLSVSFKGSFVESCDGIPVVERRGRLAWTSSPPYPLCHRRTGEVLRKLPFPGKPGPFGKTDLSDDGRYFLAQQQSPKLFELERNRPVTLRQDPKFLQFAGNLLVGYTNDFYGVWDPKSGRVIARFVDRGDLPLATSAELKLAAAQHSRKPLALYGFIDGKPLADLGVRAVGDVRFSNAGGLSIVERGWVSFWRVPAARRLMKGARPERVGRLLLHEAGVVFLADTGQFDVGGQLPAGALRCEVGLFELPIDICTDALREPGLGRALIAP